MQLTSTILSLTWILLHKSAALPSLILLMNIPDSSSAKWNTETDNYAGTQSHLLHDTNPSYCRNKQTQYLLLNDGGGTFFTNISRNGNSESVRIFLQLDVEFLHFRQIH